jgi:hypothetical protein
MDGSQPAAIGELHPRPAVAPLDLRRSELPRHPLILDGFFPTSRLRRFIEIASTPHRRPFAGNCACTFYLVFKEPAFPRPPTGLNISVWGTLREYFKRHSPVNTFLSSWQSLEGSFPPGRTTRKGIEGRSYLSGQPAGSRSVHSIYVSQTDVSTLSHSGRLS